MQLDNNDLKFAITRLPKKLRNLMTTPKWQNKIFIAGGYLRAIVANEKLNDIDIFVSTRDSAKALEDELLHDQKYEIFVSENATTIKTNPTIQIITRWLFNTAEDTAKSFDFTICSAVLYYDGVWKSFCDDRFYIDLASKRLVYKVPERNEDAGGSILRVLKYYQRGYRIPLDSLAAVIARLMKDYKIDYAPLENEKSVAHVITGLLREVDPNIGEEFISHFPSTDDNTEFEKLFAKEE